MPLGVLVALYLTEFAGDRAARSIRLALDLMNGLPSIIIGLFIFGLLVDHNHQSAYAASIALAIIMLPLIARGSQEILLLVPASLREAADALGVSRWRTVLGVDPSQRARGDRHLDRPRRRPRRRRDRAAAPRSARWATPSNYSLNITEAVPNIPMTIFTLSEEANPEGFARAWGAGFVLLAFIVLASLGARVLHARSQRKMTS